MFTCARCGETVTVPYFYQGAVYGYTCIDIVCPGTRKQTKKSEWVEIAEFSLVPQNEYETKCGYRRVIVTRKNSKKRVVLCAGLGPLVQLADGKLYVEKNHALRNKI